MNRVKYGNGSFFALLHCQDLSFPRGIQFPGWRYLLWHLCIVIMAYNLQMFFLFFSADRCVGPAATVAGLTFLELRWSREPRSRSKRCSLVELKSLLFLQWVKIEKYFVYVLLCRWGLWNTAIVDGPAIQLSPIAIELHRSRHSHDILRGNFSCCADKAWSSALLCGLDAHDVSKMISLKTKIWLRAMCLSVVFYCARRSIDVTTRQLGLSFKNLVSYLHWHIIFWKFYQHLVWLYQLTKLVILKYPFHLCPLSLCSWLVRISYKYFFFVI